MVFFPLQIGAKLHQKYASKEYSFADFYFFSFGHE
jgi:hypothetical protein